MAFLFQTPIKHPTHPSEPTNPTTSHAEYENLIHRENGISHTQKQRLDNQNLAPVGKGVGLTGTAINTIKCSVGAGILTFPYAFQLAGWLGGIIAFACITMPVLYCLQRIGAVRTMLLEDKIKQAKMTGLRADPSITEDEIKRLALESRDYLEYTDLAELSVGKHLRTTVAAFVLAGQIGCCAAYVIFMANNMHNIGAVVPGLSFLPRVAYIGALFPLLVLLSFVRTLKGLTPIAVLGTLLLLAGIAVVAVHGFQAAAIENRPIVLPPMIGENIVVCIGIMLFAMESVNNIPALQASMAQPSKFPMVLNTSVAGLFLLYLAVGIGGAALFGSTVNSVITKNMGSAVLGHVARGLFVAMLLLTFPFAMFPAATILERWFKPVDVNGNTDVETHHTRANSSTCYALMTNFYVVRILLCLIVVGIAIGFDDFGTFLSLIGYPCMGTLGLVIPPMMCLSLDMKSKNGRLSPFDRTLCWTIMCLGAIVCIVGTVYTVAEVLNRGNGPVVGDVVGEASKTAAKLF